MDPQSWTPEKYDFVKIFSYIEAPNGEIVGSQLGKRLYKGRLHDFAETAVDGVDYIEVQFRANRYKQAWGFRLTVQPCDSY